MTPETMQFGKKVIYPEAITGKKVIEIGSYNVNGSYATFVKPYLPSEYISVDLQQCDHYKDSKWIANDPEAIHLKEPCVNLIIDVIELLNKFGSESFDYVISTEMLEHTQYWKKAISVMKNLLKSNGYLVLTTRSPGFPLHGWPDDWWRFTLEDMKLIFSDCEILALESEKALQGVFVKVEKPASFLENALNFNVYSMK